MSALLNTLQYLWILTSGQSTRYQASYYLIPINITWNDAQKYCQSECGSDLASVHSDDDFSALQSVIDEYGTGSIWLGLHAHNFSSFADSKWIDGSTYDWHATVSTQSNRNESNCFIQSSDGAWIMSLCNEYHSFVCNHCYKKHHYFSFNALTFDAANDFCIDECDSTLAVIDSYSNHKHISQYLDSLKYRGDGNVWIGMRTNNESSPEWIINTNSTYGINMTDSSLSPWASGEPTGPKPYGCVFMESAKQWSWDSNLCSYQLQFLCDHCDSKMNKFAVIDVEATWNDANEQCKDNFGTTLASIHSDSDNQNTINLCEADFNGEQNCWIGMSDEDQESSWSWIDGSNFDYSSWDTTGNPVRPANNEAFNCGIVRSSYSFLWWDWPCTANVELAICQLPSELCYEMTVISGLWHDDASDCNSLRIGGNQEDAMMIFDERQWMNTNTTFNIEYMAKIDSNTTTTDGHFGIVIYDVDNICHWYYIGIQPLNGTIFLERKLNSTSIRLTDEDIASFSFGVYYTLKVSISFGNTLSVDLNGKEYISIVDTNKEQSDFVLSGYIGLKSHRVSLHAKYLYVSGVPINITTTESISKLYFQCPTASPTSSPTNPTVSPTTNPTTDPTYIPTTMPSSFPTIEPTSPTAIPTAYPTVEPTLPTMDPTLEAEFEYTPIIATDTILDGEALDNNSSDSQSPVSDDYISEEQKMSFLYIMAAGIILICCCISTFCFCAYFRLKKQMDIDIDTDPDNYSVIHSKSGQTPMEHIPEQSQSNPLHSNSNLRSPPSNSKPVHIPQRSPVSIPSASIEMKAIGVSQSLTFKVTPRFEPLEGDLQGDFVIEGDSDHSDLDLIEERSSDGSHHKNTISGMEIKDAEVFCQPSGIELEETNMMVTTDLYNEALREMNETDETIDGSTDEPYDYDGSKQSGNHCDSEDGGGLEAVLAPEEIPMSEGDPETNIVDLIMAVEE